MALAERSQPDTSLRLLHEARRLAAALPPLRLTPVAGPRLPHTGQHGRRRAGVGETYWQHRRYAAPEPATAIDWRQSARARDQALYVREREWEVGHLLALVPDGSASMAFSGHKTRRSKRDVMTVALLALAEAAIAAGERVMLPGAGEPRVRASALVAPLLRHRDDPLRHVMALPARSAVVLATDGMMEPALLADALRRATARQTQGVVLLIQDPAERVLAWRGRSLLTDMETEAALDFSVTGAEASAYEGVVQAHDQALRDAVSGAGWHLVTHVTGAPLSPSLADVVTYLMLRVR